MAADRAGNETREAQYVFAISLVPRSQLLDESANYLPGMLRYKFQMWIQWKLRWN